MVNDEVLERISKTFMKSYPGFSITIYASNEALAQGCVLREQSPYVSIESSHLENYSFDYEQKRNILVKTYCKEFLYKIKNHVTEEQYKDFIDKLSKIEIRMGVHLITPREIRLTIKECYRGAKYKVQDNLSKLGLRKKDPDPYFLRNVIDYSSTISKREYKQMKKDQAAGISYTQSGTIMLAKRFDKHSLFHELMHQVTSKRNENGQEICGFSITNLSVNGSGYSIQEEIGNALNEGMTEKMTSEVFGVQPSAYREFILPCNILELCVGKEFLKESFFNCDLMGIYRQIYGEVDTQSFNDFLGFLRSLEFIYDNYTYAEEKLTAEKIAVVSVVFKEVGYYLTKIFAMSLTKEINEAKQDNLKGIQLLKFERQIKSKIKKFYELMKQNFNGYSYVDDDILKTLRKELMSTTKVL